LKAVVDAQDLQPYFVRSLTVIHFYSISGFEIFQNNMFQNTMK